jgi:predicted XRE-type DNA-binding protein
MLRKSKTKVRLAVALKEIMETMTLSQAAAAKLLQSTQNIALVNYRLSGFSVERLLHFLNALGRDVEIVIRKPRSKRTGTRQLLPRRVVNSQSTKQFPTP